MSSFLKLIGVKEKNSDAAEETNLSKDSIGGRHSQHISDMLHDQISFPTPNLNRIFKQHHNIAVFDGRRTQTGCNGIESMSAPRNIYEFGAVMNQIVAATVPAGVVMHAVKLDDEQAIFRRTDDAYTVRIYDKRRIHQASRGASVKSHIQDIAALVHLNDLEPVNDEELAGRFFPRVKEFGQSPNFIYLLTDCYDYTLADACYEQSEGCFSEGEAREIFRQLMEVVYHLHGANIAHGGVQPTNIVHSRGRFLLTDYTTSVRMPSAASAMRTKPKVARNVQFVAPELVDERFRVHEDLPVSCYFPMLADIWSCGAVLFFILLGRPICSIPTTADMNYLAIERGDIKGLIARYSDIELSSAVIDLISKMMAVEPLKRISAEDVLHHRWLHENL